MPRLKPTPAALNSVAPTIDEESADLPPGARAARPAAAVARRRFTASPPLHALAHLIESDRSLLLEVSLGAAGLCREEVVEVAEDESSSLDVASSFRCETPYGVVRIPRATTGTAAPLTIVPLPGRSPPLLFVWRTVEGEVRAASIAGGGGGGGGRWPLLWPLLARLLARDATVGGDGGRG